MKKLLALILALSLIFALVACGNNHSSADDYDEEKTEVETSDTEESADTEETDSVTDDEAEAQIDKENVFFNPNNNTYDVNAISIKPRRVYWENGNLVAECFVINGFEHPVFNIDIKSITFSNPEGQIASGSGFGVLNNVTLAPYTHVVWSFTFTGDAVINAGADLSTLLCNANVSNSY